jgi:glycine/D-amino acid oxidase-like deaminating enzyme
MAFTDDLAPVLGESARLPGYYIFIGTAGFTLAPMMARLLADALESGAPLPARFAPERNHQHVF